jgi:ribosomal protein L40E
VIFVKEIKNLWVVPIVILIMGLIAMCYGLIKMYTLGGAISYITYSVICAVILMIIILLTTYAELKGIKPSEKAPEITEEAPKEEISEEKKEEIEAQRIAHEKIEEALKEEEEIPEEKIEEEVKEESVKEEGIEEEEIAEEKESEEDMVVCGGCGALVPASSKKCPNCGAEFEE